MTLLLKGLHFTITHISSIVQSCLLLIGSLLVLIPIYHFLTLADKDTLKNFSLSCIDLLGLQQVMLLPNRTTTKNSKEPLDSHSSSAMSPADDSVTYELNSPIDTQVCLLQESSSTMVAGLINIGNTCFLNSVLQVSLHMLCKKKSTKILNVHFLDLVTIVITKISNLFGSTEQHTFNI